ncbi:MAG: FkbM family methyltransferase [Pseudomonadota bacterium]
MPNSATDTVLRLASTQAFASLQPSFKAYYGAPERDAAMDVLYQRFVPESGLAFDIGAHVGDRTQSFRRLGARVVALEPQPLCAAALHEIFADEPNVTLIKKACAAKPGKLTFHVNSANPTVSTASNDFITEADGADGWADQRWDSEITVEATTLDDLIAAHGMPDFIKIDVEGFEDTVLAGLTSAPRALSFEFTTIQRQTALHALQKLTDLGPYRFDIALGESQTLKFGETREVGADTMADIIMALPHDANSGDIYAVLQPA